MLLGTNFYFVMTKKFADKYFEPWEYESHYEVNNFVNVHIGKRSSGWKPLFQKHKPFDSVKGMCDFYTAHNIKIAIEDEYGKQYTLKQLHKELIDWEVVQLMSRNDNRLSIELYEVTGRNRDRGWNIAFPIDHLEYCKHVDPNYLSDYYHDKDGYDFMIGEFA